MNIAPHAVNDGASSVADSTSEYGDTASERRSSIASQGSSSIRELLESKSMKDLVSVMTDGIKDTNDLESTPLDELDKISEQIPMIFEDENDDDVHSSSSSLTPGSSFVKSDHAPSSVAEWIEKTYKVQSQNYAKVRRMSRAMVESFGNDKVYSGGLGGSVDKYTDPERVRKPSDFGRDADVAESISMSDSESARINQKRKEMRKALQSGGKDEAAIAANILEALVSSDDSSSTSYSSQWSSEENDSDDSSSMDNSVAETSSTLANTMPSRDSGVGSSSSSEPLNKTKTKPQLVEAAAGDDVVAGDSCDSSSSDTSVGETSSALADTIPSGDSGIGSSPSFELLNETKRKPQHLVAAAGVEAVPVDITPKSAHRASQTAKEMDDMMAWLMEKEEMPDVKIFDDSPHTSISSSSPEKISLSNSSIDRFSSSSSSPEVTSGSSGSTLSDTGENDRDDRVTKQTEGSSKEIPTIPEEDYSDACDSTDNSISSHEELARQHSKGIEQLPVMRRIPPDSSSDSFGPNSSRSEASSSSDRSEDSISVSGIPVARTAVAGVHAEQSISSDKNNSFGSNSSNTDSNFGDSMSLSAASMDRLTADVRNSVRLAPLNLQDSFSSSSSSSSNNSSEGSASISDKYVERETADGDAERVAPLDLDDSYSSNSSRSSNYAEDSKSVSFESVEQTTADVSALRSAPLDLDDSLSSRSSISTDDSESSEASGSVDNERLTQEDGSLAAERAALAMALAVSDAAGSIEAHPASMDRTDHDTRILPIESEFTNALETRGMQTDTSDMSKSFSSSPSSNTSSSRSTSASEEPVSVSSVPETVDTSVSSVPGSADTSVSSVPLFADITYDQMKQEMYTKENVVWKPKGGDPALDYRAYSRALEGSKYLSTRDMLDDAELYKQKQRSYNSMQSGSSGVLSRPSEDRLREIREKILVSSAAHAVTGSSGEKMQVAVETRGGMNETCYIGTKGEPFIDAECGLATPGTNTSTEREGLIGLSVSKKKEHVGPRQKKIICWFLVMMLAAAPIAITLGILLKPDKNDEDRNLKSLREFLSKVALDGGAEFDDPNSYQSQALLWLSGNSNFLEFSAEQRIQRWVLACVFFSTSNLRSSIVWASSERWLSNEDECTWMGVTCDDASMSVTALELPGNRLAGFFPAEIVLLSSTLTTLDLNNNYLTNAGDEGHDFFRALTSLRFLHVGSNDFIYDGIPSQFGRLSDLIELDVSYTKYAGELRGAVFENMPVLKDLRMGGNAYSSSIPRQIGELPSLEFLHVENAGLTGDLSFMEPMDKIFEIWIDKNPGLGGTIPTFVGDIPSLASISVTECGLTGTIPTELGWLTDMQLMWFYSNELSGAIPSELGNLPMMRRLELSDNMLTGTMPKEICQNTVPPGILSILEADCITEVDCPCCSKCF